MADIQIIVDNDFVKNEVDRLLKEHIDQDKLWWSSKDLEYATGYSYTWITENILYSPSFKKMFDSENGGPVFYVEKRRKNDK